MSPITPKDSQDSLKILIVLTMMLESTEIEFSESMLITIWLNYKKMMKKPSDYNSVKSLLD